MNSWKGLALFAALVCFAAPSFGQGSVYQNQVFGPTGAPKGGATITVCNNAGNTLATCPGPNNINVATIYSNQALTLPLANPLTADGLGNFTFYASSGIYYYTVTGAGTTSPGPYIAILYCIPNGSCGLGTQFPWAPALASSATPVITVGRGNVNYYMNITSNVTSVTFAGAPQNGDYLGIYFFNTNGSSISTGVFPANVQFPAGFSFNIASNVGYLMGWTYNANPVVGPPAWLPTPVWGGSGAGSSFYQTVMQAGATKPQEPKLNFLAPVTATDNPGNNSTDINVPLNYQTIQNNASSLLVEPKFNVVPPLAAADNPANTRTDISIPVCTSGSSHTSGIVPDPGVSPNLNQFWRSDCTLAIPSISVTTVPNPTAAANLSNATAPWQVNVDESFGGQNPHIDIRTFGARAASPNAAPNVPGTTVTIGGGSAGATVSAANFSNGDGVTIFNAGPNRSLTTPTAPTVVSSLAATMTATGIDVNAPTLSQSTNWYYKIVGVDQGRGLSIASTPGSISNGVATLGPHTLTASSSTQTNNVVTVTTSARSPEVLSVGMMIEIAPSGASAPQYFEIVSSIPNNTSFTFLTGEDLRAGAASNAGFASGTIYYFNSNKLTLPSPATNVVQYIIYRSTDNITYTPVHLTHPIANATAATDPTYLTWDDYGATMSGSETFPYWVPATPPAATTADSLTTTVASGGGTTSLTLAATATTAVTTGTILLDACPGLQGAFASAQSGAGGMVYIPAPGASFVVNSLCDVSTYASRIGVSQAGQIVLNDTLKTGNQSWYGALTPSNLTLTSFGITPGQVINVRKANPGIWANGVDNVFWNDVFITGGTNGYDLMFIESGGNPTGILNNVSLAGGDSTDRTGVALYLAGGFSSSPNGFQAKNLTITNGSPQAGAGGQGLQASPVVNSINMGSFIFDGLYLGSRGIFYQPSVAGSAVVIDTKYEMQGAVTPYLTTYFSGGVAGGYIYLKGTAVDTSNDCVFFNSGQMGGNGNIPDFGAAVSIDYAIPNGVVACGNPFPSLNSKAAGVSSLGQTTNVGESVFGTAIDGTFATNNANPYAVQRFREGVEIGTSYSLHAANGTTAACSATSSGAGTFSGSAFFNITPVFPGNGEGSTSSSCSVSGLSSNGVALSWTGVNGASGYDIYYSSSGFSTTSLVSFNSCNVPQLAGTSVTLTVGGTCGISAPTVAASGPSGFNSQQIWAPQFTLPPITAAPTGLSNQTAIYQDPTNNWPNMKVNGNTAYTIPGISGTITNGQSICASGTIGIYTSCAGSAGNVNNAQQWSVACYSAAGSANTISGCTGPTTPASVFQYFGIVPTSAGGGTATQGIFALPGVPGRTTAVASGVGADIVATDRVSRVEYTNAGAVAVNIPAPGSAGFGSNIAFQAKSRGAGSVVTFTPGAGTCNGGATCVLRQGQVGTFKSVDNINLFMDAHEPPITCGTNLVCTRSDYGLTLSSTAGGGTLTNVAASLPAGKLITGNTYPDTVAADLSGDCSTSGSTVTTCTRLNGGTFSGVSGNLASFGAANIPADSGVVAANVVTAGSTYTSGDLVQASASTRATSDSGIATANVVTNTTGNAAAANQIIVSGSTNKTVKAIDFPQQSYIPAANCNNTSAGSGWSIGSGGTVNCRTGTNNRGGYVQITDAAATFATFQFHIPKDWDAATNPYISFDIASTDATSGHTVIPSIQVACYKGDGSTTDDVAPNAAHSLSTITLTSTTNQYWSTANVQMNATDVTGCVGGSLMQVTVGRATDTATNAEFYGASITVPRLLTVQAN